MNEKNTNDLKNVLGRTHLSEFERYCRENMESMNTSTSNVRRIFIGMFHLRMIICRIVYVK